MRKMKEKSNERDRNEKVKIAQSNNSIFVLDCALCDDASTIPPANCLSTGLRLRGFHEFNVAFYFSWSCEVK